VQKPPAVPLEPLSEKAPFLLKQNSELQIASLITIPDHSNVNPHFNLGELTYEWNGELRSLLKRREKGEQFLILASFRETLLL
jgi:hypothetical protein